MWKNVAKGMGWVLFALAAAAMLTFGILCYVSRGAVLDETKLTASGGQAAFYDVTGELAAIAGTTGRTADFDRLPKYVKDAFVAVEDKRFYKHRGIDFKRIVGAALSNLKAHSFAEGASTISQQLVKNTQLTPEKTLKRKMQELRLSIQLEKKYDKEEILRLYLGSIYFGKSAYGIEEASHVFFDKSAHELSLSQAATLAGLIRSPYRYSPVFNPEESLERRNLVLSLMQQQGYIDESERKIAADEPLTVVFEEDDGCKSYLAEAMREAAEKLNMSERDLALGGYRVYTYLDRVSSEQAAAMLREKGYYGSDPQKTASALVALDNSTGGVSVFVSRNIPGLYRYARQAGSTLKPIAVYAPALEKGYITPASIVEDVKTEFGGYAPKNYDGTFHGNVTVRYAIEHSLNVPAVRIYNAVGVEYAANFAEKLGIHLTEPSLTAALGSTEKGIPLLSLCAAYSAFPNGGQFAQPAFVQRVTDKKGRVVYERKIERTAAMGEDTAFLMSDMLRSTTECGTAKKLSNLPFSVMAKTGTVGDAEGNTDAYCMSFTSRHTLLGYMGSREEKLPNTVMGGTYPSLLSRDFYQFLYETATPEPLSPPSSVTKLSVDKELLYADCRLMLISEDAPNDVLLEEYFANRNRPTEISDRFTAPAVTGFKLTYEKHPQLSFTANKRFVYHIYRDDEQIAEIRGREGATLYLDEKAAKGKTYRYRVQASYNAASGNVYKGDFAEGSVTLPFDFSPNPPEEPSQPDQPKPPAPLPDEKEEWWWQDNDQIA